MDDIQLEKHRLGKVCTLMAKKCPSDLIHILMIRDKLRESKIITVRDDLSFECFDYLYVRVEKQREWFGCVCLTPGITSLELRHDNNIGIRDDMGWSRNKYLTSKTIEEEKQQSENGPILDTGDGVKMFCIKIKLITFLMWNPTYEIKSIECTRIFIVSTYIKILESIYNDVYTKISAELEMIRDKNRGSNISSDTVREACLISFKTQENEWIFTVDFLDVEGCLIVKDFLIGRLCTLIAVMYTRLSILSDKYNKETLEYTK